MLVALAAVSAPLSLPRASAGRALTQRARSAPVRTQALLGKLFGSDGGSMGSGSSKTAEAGWRAGTPGQERRISKSGHDITPLTLEQRIEAASSLTDFQRSVALNSGTERAFTGKTVDGSPHDNKRKGTYVCALGGLPLFKSDAKYDSGTGWPSFFQPIDPEHVVEISDSSIPFMARVEVVDARSGAHLGHVFNDGPRPTGKRYCMNAAALRFIPEGEQMPPESRPVSGQQ